MTSSAGWNSSRTRPGSSPRAATSASASPAPTSAGRVDVVTAGVGDAGDGARPRVVDEVVHRQRVEVGAQRDQPAAVADVDDQHRRRGRVAAGPAGLVERGLATALGGALLGPGQLGVGVQVAAELDELVGVLVDDLGDD